MPGLLPTASAAFPSALHHETIPVGTGAQAGWAYTWAEVRISVEVAQASIGRVVNSFARFKKYFIRSSLTMDHLEQERQMLV
jgi:hypothetical protein